MSTPEAIRQQRRSVMTIKRASSPRRALLRRLLATSVFVCTAMTGVVSIVNQVPAGASTPTCHSLGWGPNYYALVQGALPNEWGTGGFEETYSLSVPMQNQWFSDEAVHTGNVPGQDGLEVGWYVGFGNQTRTYVTAPHAYATLNGPNEIDGPSVGSNSDYEYFTWWAGYAAGLQCDQYVELDLRLGGLTEFAVCRTGGRVVVWGNP